MSVKLVKLSWKDLLNQSRKIWGKEKLTLSQIIVRMGKVFGDICRWERSAPKDKKTHTKKELQKEMGNMILSSIRWCDDLGFDPEDCIKEALKAQKKFKKNEMSVEDFQKLVKPSDYQVFLFACPASIPLNFAIHTWFVCVKNGKLSRWEVRFEENEHNPNIGKHLHLNSLPVFSGIERFAFIPKKFLWNAKLLGYIEGDENSLAKSILDFIEKSPDSYPYRDKYLLRGPNSNTYIQWILNQFPDFKIKLPWNCFGKKYKNIQL